MELLYVSTWNDIQYSKVIYGNYISLCIHKTHPYPTLMESFGMYYVSILYKINYTVYRVD